jgi:3-dehydroquinate synthase
MVKRPPMERCTRIPVSSPDGVYLIVLGYRLLAQLGNLAAGHNLGRRVAVATDGNVRPIYGDTVVASLENAGYETSLIAIPADEAHKNWESVELLLEHFLEAGLDRTSWVVALGGGVVGDTAGFAASIYMRGVPLVQVPTTLLAMADSSIGGKVGVDHPRGKNLIGAFKQPRLVVADLDTLVSLPAEQTSCGMAEVIKAAVIGDPALFELLESGSPEALDYAQALRSAIDVKRAIVERDPSEIGERALLNLGHTFGHAYEKCSGYSRLHGQAVAQGMVAAFRLACTLGLCDPAVESRLHKILKMWGLPLRWGPPDLAGDDAIVQVWEAMAADKKRQDGQLRFVLPQGIGRVRIVDDVTPEAVLDVLQETQ